MTPEEKAAQRSKDWRAKNRNRHRESVKCWAKENPEKRQLQRKKYREANREKLRAQRRKRYQENKEREVKNCKIWQENNKKKYRYAQQVSKNKRRYVMKNSPDRLTFEQWEEIKHKAGGRCYYCKQKRTLTQDHVIPLSKGGEHTAKNVVAACMPCNSRKGSRIINPLRGISWPANEDFAGTRAEKRRATSCMVTRNSTLRR